MIHRIYILILVLMMGVSAQAQLQLQPLLTDGGMVNVQMLWRVMIQNAGTVPVDAKLKLEVFEKGNRVAALVASSKQMLLKTGAGMYALQDFAPIQVLQNNSTKNWYNPNEWLSPGQYQLVYSIVTAKGDADQFSIPLDVQPMAPPELVLPEDSAVVKDKFPHFSWLPPVPVTVFKNLTYELKLVEVKPKQAKAKAMEQNRTLLFKNNLSQNTYTPSVSDVALKSGHTYAWQVWAKEGETYKLATPIWVFKMMPDSIQLKIDESPYVVLTDRFTETTNMYDGYIKFIYDNRNSDKNIQVQITDASTQRVLYTKQLPVNFGVNQIMFQNPVKLNAEQVYFLKVQSNHQGSCQLRFLPYYSN